MHQCSIRHLQQLLKFLQNAKAPDKFPIQAIVWSTLRGYVEYEVFADDWPQFSALVLRPHKHCQIKSAFHCYATRYDKLKELLQDTEIVPWGKRGIIFAACSSSTVSILHEIASQHKLLVKPGSTCRAFSYMYPQSIDTEHRSLLPPDYSLDKIHSSEAAFINHHWEFSDGVQSINLIQKQAEHLPAVCIRNAAGEMLSWLMIEFDGQVGKAYTLKEHRHKKLNNIAFKELMFRCKDQLGFTPYSYVSEENLISLSHAQALGGLVQHHRDDTYSWLRVAPIESKM